MQRALGWQWQWSYGDPLQGAEQPPLYLSYSPQLSAIYWVYCGATGMYTIDEGWNHADITPAGGISTVKPNDWSGGNLNGIAVFNNPSNDATHWFLGIGATALTLPGLRAGTRYAIMRPFKYHLIGMGVADGTGTYPDAIQWSDAADPGQIPQTWNPAADNEAGDNILADENGAIVDGLGLRDSFFIYKTDSVYEMSYIGGVEVFRFNKVFSSTGALAKDCVARVKGTHVVLGAGDVYQHDGQNFTSIVESKVRDQLFSVIDQVNYVNSFVAFNEATDEVWICIPSTGNEWPNVALVWDLTTSEWGFRDIPSCSTIAPGIATPKGAVENEAWDDDNQAWNDDSTVWLQQTITQSDDSLVMADVVNSKFYLAETGNTADGIAYDSGVSVFGMDLGDPEHIKAVRRVYFRMNAPANQEYTATIYSQQSPATEPRVEQTLTFTPNKEGLPIAANGRYFGVELYTEGVQAWDVSGIDWEYLRRGRF
jgi:hypothetical protein